MHHINTEVDGNKGATPAKNTGAATRLPQPDRHLIKSAHRRFLDYSELRLKRLKSLLLPVQRQFVEILPILFHYNHPLLPGYGPSFTPRSIAGYDPDIGLRKRVESHFHGLKLKQEHNLGAGIQGIYLIGSSGTLAQSQNSDLDFWVCTTEPLSNEQETALEHKFTAISRWAKNLSLEVHFFYMHEESFKHQRRETSGGENCGRTQHFLLLDEFYRSAIRICGQAPLWWIVPSANLEENDESQEHLAPCYSYQEFAQKISSQKFIDRTSYIDFGNTGNIPFFEYLSSSIWTLYKALQSPHKALIKLMLIEAYVENHETKKTLSEALKYDIHEAQKKLFYLDPYIQVYQRIESFLAEGTQTERIDLLRYSFYRKVDLKLSRLSDEAIASVKALLEQSPDGSEWDKLSANYWRHALMLGLTKDWGWDRDYLQAIDTHETNSITELLAEQRQLNKELLHTYRRIDSKARSVLGETSYDTYRNSDEIELLDRHLKVVFRHGRAKVGYVGKENDYRNQIKPWDHIQLDLTESGENTSTPNGYLSWSLYDHDGETKVSVPTFSAIESAALARQSSTAEEIMLWLFQHGIANKRTQFHAKHRVQKPESEAIHGAGFEGPKLDKIARAVWRFFDKPRSPTVAMQNLKQKAEVDYCLVLVNSNPERLETKLLDNVVLSDRDDPLSYTGMPRNTVSSISILWSNNWGEVFCEHFDGVFAASKALQHYIGLSKNKYFESEFDCVRGERPLAVSKRLQQLFEDANAWNQNCCEQSAITAKGAFLNKKDAFVFSTADGIFLIESTESRHSNPAYAVNYGADGEFWPINELSPALLVQISDQWQACFDPISFPYPGNQTAHSLAAS